MERSEPHLTPHSPEIPFWIQCFIVVASGSNSFISSYQRKTETTISCAPLNCGELPPSLVSVGPSQSIRLVPNPSFFLTTYCFTQDTYCLIGYFVFVPFFSSTTGKFIRRISPDGLVQVRCLNFVQIKIDSLFVYGLVVFDWALCVLGKVHGYSNC